MRSHRHLLARALFLTAIVALITALPRSVAASPLVVLQGYPALKQQHSLTCESSAASMATRGVISETQIMAAMPRNPNPNLGFRGDPNGFQGTNLVDYGVYAQPIHQALLGLGYQSNVLSYGTIGQLQAYVNKGWPVVLWVTYQLQSSTPRLGQSGGVDFILVPHEHAILMFGYDKSTLIANDPWTGKQVRYYWSQFKRSWGYFGNLALAVAPCPSAAPVQRVRTSSVSASGITWTWKKPLNAVHYNIVVTRIAKHDTVVYQGTTDARRYTLANPDAGASYQIDVQSISACGITSQPTTMEVALPAAFATATPQPEKTIAVTPTPTATPGTATATPAASPTPTATPHQ